MSIKKQLERLAAEHGARLEEDEGYRDVRVFQIVAPVGMRWRSGSVICIRVEADSKSKEAIKDTEERLVCGLEVIPSDELSFYAED